MGTSTYAEIVASIRQQCMRKGLNGIKGLAVLFRGMDKDYSKTLSYQELKLGMKAYQITINDEQLATVFQHLDKDRSDSVDFREFLVALSPPMNLTRVSVINQAFDKLDENKDGVLKVEDIAVAYKSHAQQHPNYKSGKWTLQETLEQFLKSFENPDEQDGQVTREEFLNYYACVSVTVEDDCYFDHTMRSTWGLPQKKLWSSAD